MICFGNVPLGSVLPVFFSTYGKTNGESITLTGLAVTDIEIYKGTSMTQRSSDAGYTLLDTDGIDIDTITGIHGFSIDTGDNTDAGFYAAGSFYNVVVSAVTVDSQTVNFIAATFRLVAQESVSGVTEVDVTHFGGTAGTFSGGRAEVIVQTNNDKTGYAIGSGGIASTAFAAGAIDASAIAADAIGAAEIANGAIDAATFSAGAIDAAAIANGAIDAATFAAGAIDAAAIANGAIDAATFAANAIDAAALATDAVNEIRDSVFARTFSAAYGSHTFDELMKMVAATLLAKCSGMATATGTFRNLADTGDVIVATIDADGNRSAVTRTP